MVHDFLSKVSVSAGTISFISSASGVGTTLFGIGLPAGASLGVVGLVCGIFSELTGAIAKRVSHKINKHEQTVAICEFHNIISEVGKYHEMKRDIRAKN